MSYNNIKVAVTGGTGCLGSPLVEKLVKDGIFVKLLTLTNDSHFSYSDNKIEIIIGDINCSDALDKLCKNCSVIFHLAGAVHVDKVTKTEEQKFFRVNLEGTKNLLKASEKNGVKRVVFFSTVGVYGHDADFSGDELSVCKPNSAYAMSKYQAEQLILNGSSGSDLEGVVLRLPVAYGPLDKGNMAKLIKTIRDRLFFYFGDGNCLRSMISSRNAAEAAVKAAFIPRAANEIFCITDGQDYTTNEIVGCVCRILRINREPYHVPVFLANLLGKMGDVLRKYLYVPVPIDSDRVRKLSRPLTFSCEKAKRVLGYKPVETLEHGLLREAQWLETL